MQAELKPCPFCGGEMSVRSNRDWHRLVGEHAEGWCLMSGFEPYCPATPDARNALVEAWNRRTTDGVQPCDQCHGTGEYFVHADECDDDLCALNGDMHSCAGKVEPCHCSAAHGVEGRRHQVSVPESPVPAGGSREGEAG